MKTSIVLALALLASCSSDLSSGTGSQTGNSIVAGRILTADSTNPAGTVVYLRPLDWTPSQAVDSNSLLKTTLDSDGNFVFREVPPKTYRIEARRGDHGWSKTVKATAGSHSIAPTGTLVGQGRLMCEVHMNDTLVEGRIELYGLDRSIRLPAFASGEWKYLIDSLPVGLQTVRIWSAKTNSVIANLPIRIEPYFTASIEYESGRLGVEGPEEDDR